VKKEEPVKTAGPSAGGPGGKYNDGFDNEEGEYIVTPGEFFGYDKNYQVIERVGNGQFGQVVKAWDKLRRCTVAVKIIKNKKVFLEQAQHEIQILGTLQKFAKTNEAVLGVFVFLVEDLEVERVAHFVFLHSVFL
jgi:serine/threonine protein kinase